MTPRIRLIAGFFTVGAWTLLSRILGFLREVLIAGFLGAGPVVDAFIQAFSLPNMFRRFFAEGAFNMAFVPIFSKKLEARDNPEGFANDAFTGLATILIVLTLVAQIAMPALIIAIAAGFRGDERFDLAVFYGRICFPYILFISLAALLSGVLNATGRFAAAAAAPVILNIILIGALTLAWWQTGDFGLWLSQGVVAAGVAQLTLVWFAAARAGFPLRFKRPQLTPDLKNLAVIALPAALAGGVMQVNLIVGRQVASPTEGAVAWLYYADRIYQLPLGVVGIAIGVVLLPDLSRRLQAGDITGSRAAFNRSIEFALALTLPATAGFVVMPTAVVSVLFERGAFTAEDSAATGLALAIYALGLPFFVLQKVLQPLFFARQDTKSPFCYALVSMGVNAGLAIGLASAIGYLAAALGTIVSAAVMVVLLWCGSRNMGKTVQTDDRLRRVVPRLVVASLFMAGAVWGLGQLLSDALMAEGSRYLALAGVIAGGLGTYCVAAFALGGLSVADLCAAVRR
ncbi:MAG: murein biosynthesis integral membrane protein MurJ [Rhodobacteraceae bacterium]|nr:murein biosynthesis integral membrane protein MurJ [Paracoccaceae bacterium]